MAIVESFVLRTLEQAAELYRTGKLPMLAKGGFNVAMMVVGYMAVGYLSNIDNRFEGIEKGLKELNERQTTGISRHDHVLENHELRIGKLEIIFRPKPKGEKK